MMGSCLSLGLAVVGYLVSSGLDTLPFVGLVRYLRGASTATSVELVRYLRGASVPESWGWERGQSSS